MGLNELGNADRLPSVVIFFFSTLALRVFVEAVFFFG